MNLNRQMHNIDVCRPIPAVDVSTGRFFLITDTNTDRQGRIIRRMMIWSNKYGQSFREGCKYQILGEYYDSIIYESLV